jgi:hypothetical protein
LEFENKIKILRLKGELRGKHYGGVINDEYLIRNNKLKSYKDFVIIGPGELAFRTKKYLQDDEIFDAKKTMSRGIELSRKQLIAAIIAILIAIIAVIIEIVK